MPGSRTPCVFYTDSIDSCCPGRYLRCTTTGARVPLWGMKIGTCSHPFAVWLTIAFLSLSSGCTSSVGSASGIRLDGIDTSIGLKPKPVTRAYVSTDPSTADFYLTDLSEDALEVGSSLSGVSGTITHVHLFAIPKAGKTPIDRTASTAAVRTLVIAQGHLGVYGGGGFMLPSGKPGARSFGGSISGASIRLTSTTPGFEDRIGAGEFSARLSTPLDQPTAIRIAARLEELIRLTSPVTIGDGIPDDRDEVSQPDPLEEVTSDPQPNE